MGHWAIIGGGNGGQAFAGYLSLKGETVKIFDVFQETVDKLNKLGGVKIEGNVDVSGFGKILGASTDLKTVIDGAKIIMVVLPSLYHIDMAKKMAPLLKDDQIVLLHPSASLGPIEFDKALKDAGCKVNYIVATTNTLLFACRALEVGVVQVYGQKTFIDVAAYPSSKNDIVKKAIIDIFPQSNFVDVIHASLTNLNSIVHPAPSILNIARIESGMDWMYYTDFTPTIGKCVDELDVERLKIGKAYGIELESVVDIYKRMYTTKGDNSYEVMKNCEAYMGIKGQSSIRTRYVLEDVPNSLVPYRTLAEIAGFEVPLTDAIIKLSYAIVDGIIEGRTAKKLGLENVSKDEFIKMCRN